MWCKIFLKLLKVPWMLIFMIRILWLLHFFLIIVNPCHAVPWLHLKVSIRRHFQQHFDSVHTFTDTSSGTRICTASAHMCCTSRSYCTACSLAHFLFHTLTFKEEIFMVESQITKFTKALRHESLELYSRCDPTCKDQVE